MMHCSALLDNLSHKWEVRAKKVGECTEHFQPRTRSCHTASPPSLQQGLYYTTKAFIYQRRAFASSGKGFGYSNLGKLEIARLYDFLLFLTEYAIIINNAVSVGTGLGSMAAIDRMLCRVAEHFCISEGLQFYLAKDASSKASMPGADERW